MIDKLRCRGFTVREVSRGVYQAVKKLEPVGIKNRVIHFVVVSTSGKADLALLKRVNKMWDRLKPGGWRTFYLYNVVLNH